MGLLTPGDYAMRDKWESSSVRTYNYTFFLLFALVLLLVIASFPIVAAQENEKSNFEFTFEEGNYQEMKVGPSHSKRVSFRGKIKYVTSIPQARQIAINLRVNPIHDPSSAPSKGAWLASVTPPVLYMNSLQEEEDIRIDVLGYPFENKDVSYDIVLSGTWQANPGGSGVIDPFTLTSTSTQYFQIRVTSLDSFTTGYPGERRSFSLHVKNDGNGPDAFNIEFDKPIQESLISIGFVFIYNTKRTEMIGANQIANYTFEVIGPKTFVPWQTRITEVALIVSSEGAMKGGGGSEIIKYSVFYQEKGTHYDIEPCLGAMLLIMIILPLSFFFIKRYRLKRRRKRTSSGKG